MEGKSRGVVIKTGGETVMGSITALVAGLDSGQTSINMRTFIQEPLDGRFWGTLPGFAPILILINDRAVTEMLLRLVFSSVMSASWEILTRRGRRT